MSTRLDTPEVKRLRRTRPNRMLAGVCGGLAEYFDLHPAVFRVAFVVIALLPGAGVLIYLAAALVMPDEGREDSIVAAALRDRRERPWPLIGLGLFATASAMLVSPVGPEDDVWILPLVAGAVVLWLARRDVAGAHARDAGARAREDGRRLRRLVAVLIATAASIAAVAAALAAGFDVRLGDGVGERSHVATTTQDLRREYRLGVGELQVDLAALALPVGETHVEARVDVGELRVVVPEGVALRVRADARLGEIHLPGESADGVDVEARVEQPGRRVLVLDARVRVGSVDVVRAVR
jgi:phage shock protein PspC (stress-responsive transcriptional regulator)